MVSSLRVLVCACILLLALLSATCSAQHSIVDYGAIAGDSSWQTAVLNSAAIVKAFAAANDAGARAARIWDESRLEERWDAVLAHSAASYAVPSSPALTARTLSALLPPLAQTVVVPAAADGAAFTIAWTLVQGVSDVALRIDGQLAISSNSSLFTHASPFGVDFGALQFEDCTGLTIVGKPQSPPVNASSWPVPSSPPDIDGAGYSWWMDVILGAPDHRPHMFYFVRSRSVAVLGLYIRDSPMFHFLTADSADLFWKNITIYVDTEAQSTMLREAGFAARPPPMSDVMLDDAAAQRGNGSLPLFPLNTDGIDPSAMRVLIEDFYIENYDDAIAVKPCLGGSSSTLCQCASDMIARHGRVKYSVGLTIGSVPPAVGGHCVRNVTFDHIHMDTPFKALYIKTNPGDQGDGVIDQISYTNIDAITPLWYPLWIGPQQQKQPANGTDTGCSFLYPLNTTCATQPRVTISNVSLRNVSLIGGLTLPGVLLCDPANPCKGIVFDNVTITGEWLVQKDFVCSNVQGTQHLASPTLACLTPTSVQLDDNAEEDDISVQ